MCLLKREFPLRKYAAYDNVYICKVLLIINFGYIEANKNIRFLFNYYYYHTTTTTCMRQCGGPDRVVVVVEEHQGRGSTNGPGQPGAAGHCIDLSACCPRCKLAAGEPGATDNIRGTHGDRIHPFISWGGSTACGWAATAPDSSFQ